MNIITLSQFQDNFNASLEKSINKKFNIKNELNEIESFIHTVPVSRTFQKPKKLDFAKKSIHIFRLEISDYLRSLFSDAFNKYTLEGEYKLERVYTDTDDFYKIKEDIVKQSYEFSEYYKWLNEFYAVPEKAQKKNSLPIKQKLLALHYLGLDTRGNDNNKIAEILATILDVGSENIRKSLSHLYAGKNNEVRTKNNLTEICQLFENQGLIEISNKIKSDIEKL